MVTLHTEIVKLWKDTTRITGLELPDNSETTTYISLTKSQFKRYKARVKKFEKITGIQLQFEAWRGDSDINWTLDIGDFEYEIRAKKYSSKPSCPSVCEIGITRYTI